VLDEALAQERRWTEAGQAIPVAVNLSARNLVEDGLVEQVTELLRRHGVPPDLLELEITESCVVSDVGKVKRLLARLRALGLRVAVDDFGTGFTTLAELKDLPIDVLKVDRSFIKGMAENANHLLIVQSVLELSRNLGLTAVAEGVEDQGAMAALQDLGCQVAQGYHIARPLPAEEFSKWYRQWGSAHPAACPPVPVPPSL
jgi:EAL domain-containing protein (putative c-di-GMP-specific phosphodiesterase class I)